MPSSWWEKAGAVLDVATDTIPIAGIGMDAAQGLVLGNDAVAQNTRNEEALMDIKNSETVQETGLADYYDGLMEMPGSEYIKVGHSLDKGATKAGAFIHNALFGDD